MREKQRYLIHGDLNSLVGKVELFYKKLLKLNIGFIYRKKKKNFSVINWLSYLVKGGPQSWRRA